jgi:hypothetical protein
VVHQSSGDSGDTQTHPWLLLLARSLVLLGRQLFVNLSLDTTRVAATVVERPVTRDRLSIDLCCDCLS